GPPGDRARAVPGTPESPRSPDGLPALPGRPRRSDALVRRGGLRYREGVPVPQRAPADPVGHDARGSLLDHGQSGPDDPPVARSHAASGTRDRTRHLPDVGGHRRGRGPAGGSGPGAPRLSGGVTRRSPGSTSRPSARTGLPVFTRRLTVRAVLVDTLVDGRSA